MTFNAASNFWQYTATIPNSATQLDCVFNNGAGLWDNNSSANWVFNVLTNGTPEPPAAPQNLTANPAATNQINLSWSTAAGASGYLVSRGGSLVALTTGTSYSDTGLAVNSPYCYSVVASNSVGLSAPSATVCTNTLLPPFVLDGAFDYPGYLLASNGMVLYAAMRGTTLYVATWSPGSSGPNDDFIFVSDQLLPAATSPAPWAKAGLVAVSTNKPYLAGESQNTYVSWYTNGVEASLPCAKAATTSGAMEGTLDLVNAFGYMPTNLYLCAAAYVTTNGGPLVAACPAGSGPNIGTNGFFVIPTAALADNNGDGQFDLMEPSVGFAARSLLRTGSGYAVNWAAMPGRSYQIAVAPTLGAAWSNLPGSMSTAGQLQLSLSYTDAPPASVSQRFYRVVLVP